MTILAHIQKWLTVSTSDPILNSEFKFKGLQHLFFCPIVSNMKTRHATMCTESFVLWLLVSWFMKTGLPGIHAFERKNKNKSEDKNMYQMSPTETLLSRVVSFNSEENQSVVLRKKSTYMELFLPYFSDCSYNRHIGRELPNMYCSPYYYACPPTLMQEFNLQSGTEWRLDPSSVFRVWP